MFNELIGEAERGLRAYAGLASKQVTEQIALQAVGQARAVRCPGMIAAPPSPWSCKQAARWSVSAAQTRNTR